MNVPLPTTHTFEDRVKHVRRQSKTCTYTDTDTSIYNHTNGHADRPTDICKNKCRYTYTHQQTDSLTYTITHTDTTHTNRKQTHKQTDTYTHQ